MDELFDNISNSGWQQNPGNDLPKIDRKGFYEGHHGFGKRSLEDDSSRVMQFVGVLRHMAVGVRKAGR